MPYKKMYAYINCALASFFPSFPIDLKIPNSTVVIET